MWYGTPELWTLLDRGGQARTSLPVSPEGTLTNKTFWWSEDYSPGDTAEITVTGEQLEDSLTTFEVKQTIGDGHNPFMLQPTHESVTVVGVDLPQRGCWQITGHYKGASLSYVIWVP